MRGGRGLLRVISYRSIPDEHGIRFQPFLVTGEKIRSLAPFFFFFCPFSQARLRVGLLTVGFFVEKVAYLSNTVSQRSIRLARVKVGGGWNERMLEKGNQDPTSQKRMGGGGVSVPQM